MERICIYPKDVQIITGKSERWGRIIIARIKAKNKKQQHQVVSVQEFCDYMGLSREEVESILKIKVA